MDRNVTLLVIDEITDWNVCIHVPQPTYVLHLTNKLVQVCITVEPLFSGHHRGMKFWLL